MPNGLPESLPKSMTAIAIREPGGPEVLVPQQRPVPAPGEGEILVKVAAAGVNRCSGLENIRRRKAPPSFLVSKSPVK